MAYYFNDNSWWTNHNSANNWYMDPHKSGTLNQPPPAHNMSGPPQHPPPHGLPMGQNMVPGPLQSGYIPPRAHTGPSVPMSQKPTQPLVLGSKQPHPGGASSPKLPPTCSTPPQDKTMLGGSPKPPNQTSNLSSNMPVGGNKSPIVPSLTLASASKSLHSLQQPQHHQLNLMQQQRQAQQQYMQHQQQQAAPGQQQQQQMNASQQQMQVNQQHLQQQILQSQVQQQQQQQPQVNLQPNPVAIQQHNQNLQPKAPPPAPAQNLLSQAKPELSAKGPTPPVPGLISIKHPPTSQPLPASAPVKPLISFENKIMNQNQPMPSKSFQQQNSTNSNSIPVAVSSAKPAQNAISAAMPQSGNSGFPLQVSPSKALDVQQKTSPNVSITPAKPISTSQKPEVSKASDSTNTVTITPSIKSAENQEIKTNDPPKANTDTNAQNTVNMGPNQNGMATSKMPIKCTVPNVAAKLVESSNSEFKAASSPPLDKSALPSTIPLTSAPSTKSNQSFPKQISNVPIPRQSPTKPPTPPPKPPSAVKPPNISPPTNQVETSSVSNNQPLQTKSLQPYSTQKGIAPSGAAITKTAVSVLQTPKVPPTTTAAPLSQTNVPAPKAAASSAAALSPSKSNLIPSPAVGKSAGVASKENASNLQPLSKKATTTTTTTTTEKPVKPEVASKPEAKKVEPSNQIMKREVGRFPRSRKLVEKEPPKPVEVQKTPKYEEDDEELDSDEEMSTPKKRATRSKRKISDTPSEGERRSKRSRNPATVYQSPVPDSLSRLTKSFISTPKTPQEKLVIFFKNEHVALRNAEGTFYLCQIAQNVYKSTRKIKIRWLSPTAEDNETCDTYKPDYYDVTDFDCILTSVALQKSDKSIMRLPAEEKTRILNILKRAIDRDQGIPQEKSELNEDHPDGLDLSLYNDESQLKKRKGRKKGKRNRSDMSASDSDSETEDEDEEEEEEEEEEEMEEQEEEEKKKEAEPKEPPTKVAKVAAAQRGTRGTTSRGKSNVAVTPAPTATPKAPAAATPKASAAATPKASAPPTPVSSPTTTPAPTLPQTPSSRRGVRTFGSSRSVTRARIPVTQAPVVPPAAAAAPKKETPSPSAPTKTDTTLKANSQDLPPKTPRGTRSGPKQTVSKASVAAKGATTTTPPKEATPATKLPPTRRTRK